MTTKPALPAHPPQRADAVKKRQPGKASKPVPDPATAARDPGRKSGNIHKEEDAIVAELDQGPLEA